MIEGFIGRNWALLVVAVTASAYAVLCLALTRHGAPLTPDAVEYAQVARNLAAGEGFNIDFIEFHPGFLSSIRHPLELHGVLTPLVLAPFFRIWGPNPAFVRIPGIVACAGIVIAAYALARQTFGTSAGLLAAFGFLLREDFIGDAVLGGDDVGWTLFSTLAVLYFLRGFEIGQTRLLVLAGIFAAAATLQKYTGVVLAVLFCSALFVRQSNIRARIRDSLAVAGPVLLAAAVYAWKNHATHGKWGFRFTALDWLSREDFSAYFAYYEKAPRLSDAWAHLGFRRVAQLCAVQGANLWQLAVDNKFTTFGGLTALAWAARHKPAFGGIGLLYSAALAAVLCVLYHVEPRYLFALVPLYYAAMAGAVVEMFDRMSRRLPERASPFLCVAISIVGVALLARATTELVRSGRKLDAVMSKQVGCDDSFQFIRSSVPRNEPILSSSPWYVTWLTEHPSVAAPSNGVRALLKVADHYGVRWAVTGLSTPGGANVEEDLRGIVASGSRPSPRRVFDGATCDVYRLDP